MALGGDRLESESIQGSRRQQVFKTRNTRGMVSYTFVSHQRMVIRYQFHLE